MMGILGVGLGATSAAIPGLIVGAVPEEQTGSALGFFQVVRYIGFSLGSALTGGDPGQSHPGWPSPAHGWWLHAGAVDCRGGVRGGGRAGLDAAHRRQPGRVDEQMVEDDAELGPTGFVEISVPPVR
jgi:hypothetical protein